MRFSTFCGVALLSFTAALACPATAQTVPTTTPPQQAPPASAAAATTGQKPLDDTTVVHPWSLHFQQTVIDQWHSNLHSPYGAAYSLADREKAKLSLTTTLFIGRRLWKGAALYFNPEVAGGSGLSGARGIAGFPNGETFRIGDPSPSLYLARLYLHQIWALSSTTAAADDGPNQLGGPLPTRYLALSAGKFGIADFFDQNSYSHDPRTQFFNWSLMSAGGWDYPANTRGYTVGAVLEYITPAFALRFGTTVEPADANGPVLNFHYGRSHAETLELTKSYHLGPRAGTVRVLGFRNVAAMGDYRAAIAAGQSQYVQPDVTSTRRDGRTKSGFGISADQEISANVGVFARLNYNDGKYETWAFTEIDRSASLGLSSTGTRWHRPDDRLGVAVVANGLSAPHHDYLGAGGYGFILGDGRLNYAPEYIAEAYYSFAVPRYHAALSPDYQFIVNPGYNRDRGPVHVVGLRLHVAF